MSQIAAAVCSSLFFVSALTLTVTLAFSPARYRPHNQDVFNSFHSLNFIIHNVTMH